MYTLFLDPLGRLRTGSNYIRGIVRSLVLESLSLLSLEVTFSLALLAESLLREASR